MEPPGATTPLLLTSPETVPWPRSVPSAFTRTLPPSTALAFAASPTASVPPATVVDPEKLLLTPFNVSVPVPCLINDPLPLRLPPKAWDESSASVSALPFSTTRLPATPERCATVWPAPADRSSADVAPVSATVVPEASRPAPVNASVPALIVVAPP